MADSFSKAFVLKFMIEAFACVICLLISCAQASKDGFIWIIPALIAYGLAPTVLNDFERVEKQSALIPQKDWRELKSKPWEWWAIGIFGFAVLCFIVYLFLYQID